MTCKTFLRFKYNNIKIYLTSDKFFVKYLDLILETGVPFENAFITSDLTPLLCYYFDI